jgi:NifU-like protein
VAIYPQKVDQRAATPRSAGQIGFPDASGRSASFICGCFAAFSLRVENKSTKVTEVAFQTNGCGFMIAAADVLSETVGNSDLADLHGLKSSDLFTAIDAELDAFPVDRRQCADVCIEALRNSFADLRARRVEEFRGEKALICTCFGVSEEIIEDCIAREPEQTVDDVSAACNAGSGCGSCRMLIQEMLDSHFR